MQRGFRWASGAIHSACLRSSRSWFETSAGAKCHFAGSAPPSSRSTYYAEGLALWIQRVLRSGCIQAREQARSRNHLYLPQHIWTVCLGNPSVMNTRAIYGSCFPNLMSRASALTREARGILGTSPVVKLKSLTHIDAHLRRGMDAVLQTYSASFPSAQIVFLNALQLCGKNVPYMMGILVADTIQCSRGFCDAPPLVSPMKYDDVRLVKTNHNLIQWVRAVMLDVTQNATTVFHVLRIVLLFAPLLATAPLVFYWGVGRSGWMEALRQTMEVAGPAFIKWAQWAATRKDMFPPDMCLELERLQCSAPAHGWPSTKKAIEESLGWQIGELVDWIDEVPVASGSIGQVHRARLSEQAANLCGMPIGTVVAIKVKHPGVSKSIQRDFSIMMWIAQQVEWIPTFKKLHLSESLAQFAAPLREQVDLLLEARTLWRFGKNFSRDKDVTLPVPLYPWVSQDVLMQTFEEGMHISTYMELDQDADRRAAVADVGSNCMLDMMLVHNLIHSDLHPGNILVRWCLPDGWLIGTAAKILQFLPVDTNKLFEHWLKPEVVLLDVGMATELSGDDRNNMLALFQAFSNLDGAAMADATLSFAGKAQGCLNPQGFRTAIDKSMESMKVNSWSDTEFTSPAAALASVLEIVREYEVTLPGHICAVLVTVLVLEGWSSTLKPDHSVLTAVKHIVALDSCTWIERLNSSISNWMEWAPVLPSWDTC